MKKIFTFFAVTLLTLSLFAADRRPVVKINSDKNYKFVIDGRTYFGSDLTLSLDHFNGGRHSIKVFEMKRGYYGSREKLVAATTFQLDRNDVMINIGWSGNISIREKRGGGRFDNDRNPWNDRDGHNRDRDGRY